jgi:hypothetical protein
VVSTCASYMGGPLAELSTLWLISVNPSKCRHIHIYVHPSIHHWYKTIGYRACQYSVLN